MYVHNCNQINQGKAVQRYRLAKTEIGMKQHKNITDTFKTKLICTKNRDYYIG